MRGGRRVFAVLIASLSDQSLQCHPLAHGGRSSPILERFIRSGADAARGHVDDSVERHRSCRVLHEPQISENILDFAAFVEAGGPHQAVAHLPAHAGLLQGTTLRVCAVDDRGLAQSHSSVGAQAGSFIQYVVGLFSLVVGFVNRNLYPFALVSAKTFGRTICILGNNGIGDIENVLGAAIVLLQEDDLCGGVVAAKAQDVAVVGAAKAVDRLVFVADDKKIAPAVRRADEERCQLVLRRICILKLIYEHVAPLVLIFAPDSIVLAQQ